MDASRPQNGCGAEEVGPVVLEGGAPLRSSGVSAPRTAEEWDNFITRYSLGEFYTSNFADSPSSPAPIPPVEGVSKALAATSLEDPKPVVGPAPALRSRTIPLSGKSGGPTPLQDSSGPDSSGTDHSDLHPDVSASGPANQDPDIPNILNASLPSDFPSGSRPPRKSKKKKPAPPDGQAMTTENMRQLDQVTLNPDPASRSKDGNKGSRRGQRSWDGQRRPVNAELASVGRSVSRGSSSERESPLVSSRERPPPKSLSRGSKGSWRPRHSYAGSAIHGQAAGSVDATLLESNTNSSTSVSEFGMDYDQAAERGRIRDFYAQNGYMPAPREPLGALRRRLRVIRRLGLEHPSFHRETMDRFTRLAVNIFKAKGALVSIVAKDRQLFLSEIGFNRSRMELDIAICSHTIIGTGKQCMIVPDAKEDWRFRSNPLVDQGNGPIRFYAGAPLVVGNGSKSAIIGSLCVVDSQPRDFSKEDQLLLQDLAECVVSELELVYSQQAVDSAKLHQVSVEFLRRSLKNRPAERAGKSRPAGTSSASSDSKKRKEGADVRVSEDDVDIYDEACREIRQALDAYAVAVVDLSQFHLFYPAYQSSSTAGTSTRGDSTSVATQSMQTGSMASQGPASTSSSARGDDNEAYAKSGNLKRARKTWAITDVTAPSRTPQVLFIPGRRKPDLKRSKYMKEPENVEGQEELAVLGYSCAHDGFAFNFTSSPAARKIISDFIAGNVKTRRVWYTRDDSEGIAQSITHLMPPGTETSMAMPVFGFDGQVAFAIVACWTDPLYSYPAGAMHFVETISGSLLASVMKERLHLAERSQLNFAAAASHELRTPLHQLNAAATLLRSALLPHLSTPRDSPTLEALKSPLITAPGISSAGTMPAEDRVEALAQLEIIEANGLSLGNILENIIDTLDIGRLSSRHDVKLEDEGPGRWVNHDATPAPRAKDFGQVLEKVVTDALALESKSRRVQGGRPMDEVEVILEVTPRQRGGWMMTDDSGPLVRALGEIIHNACKFTEKGCIHVTVQDISRDVVLPAGFDNSIKLSTVSIDIKDSGRGMTPDFLEKEVLLPFTKADPFMPGAGLGLGLAQRMVEILGGKLAIASTLYKGTIVRVEVPLHLLNQDNESDEEELEESSNGAGRGSSRPHSPVRQDGIFLAGFDGKDRGTRRVGKSLLRTLKLRFCRVVTGINYASLIVAPEGVTEVRLADLARQARPGVHIIILGKENASRSNLPDTPTLTPSSAQAAAQDYLQRIPTTYLTRPLRPSLISQIVKPADAEPPIRETFVSDVVGGHDARLSPVTRAGETTPGSARPTRPNLARGDSVSTLRPSSSAITFDSEILPSSANPPRPDTRSSSIRMPGSAIPDGDASGADMRDGVLPKDDTPVGNSKESHFLPSLRPALHEQASDPFPALAGPLGWSDSSDSMDSAGAASRWPELKEAKSMPAVQETTQDDPLRVLVVEDNAACHYAEAVDGVDAVEKFLSYCPNLVLLDINMPRKDGFAAAAEMRDIEAKHRRSRATIIAVTAMSGEAQKRRGLLECGVDEWRTKPVRIKELKSDVERLKVAMM